MSSSISSIIFQSRNATYEEQTDVARQNCSTGAAYPGAMCTLAHSDLVTQRTSTCSELSTISPRL